VLTGRQTLAPGFAVRGAWIRDGASIHFRKGR
jgi:hypothetical protein